ncbi:MAG: hypothetical protein M1451_09840 [Acidobacteria bacterium]|nr:hypothetical protein [Acidobacteriota bacterium]
MRNRVLILAVLLASVPVLAATQELLPATLGEWVSTLSLTVEPREIEKLAGEEAALMREYGVTGAEQRTYSRGVRSLKVTVFLFADSTTAYGAYSFLRLEAANAEGLTPSADQQGSKERMLLGNLIVEVSGNGLEAQRGAVKNLLKQLLIWSDSTPYPLLAQSLPTEGLLRGSERFVLSATTLARVLPIERSDWASFQYGAEALLARYRVEGKETTLLLISYPTPQAAKLKQAELGRWFNVNNSETSPTQRPVAHVRRILSVLALALNSKSPQAAQSVLGQVQFQPNFSWNEPSHRATDPPILFSIYGIIIGTMVLLAFTFVAGLSFGGLRIVIKHFFPGRVFDRADTMQILQLGLSSKPIEAKDFY